MYEKVLKPLFFLMSPERAHYAAMDLLVCASRVPGVSWWMKRRAAKRNEGRELGDVFVDGTLRAIVARVRGDFRKGWGGSYVP